MSWRHLRDATLVARKPHRCYLCSEPILAREIHVRRSGTANGEIDSFRMHLECERETAAWDASIWECFSEGEMDRPSPNPNPSLSRT